MRLARRGYQRVSFTYIYAIQACSAPYLVKLGQSLQPRSRMKEMAVGCPTELNLIWLVKAHAIAEEFLHKVFAADRVKGEWFRPSEPLKGFIRQCKKREIHLLTPDVLCGDLPNFVPITPETLPYYQLYPKLFELFPRQAVNSKVLAWRNATV